MSQQKICDLDGTPIDPMRDLFYTITDGRMGVAKDICFECARSTSSDVWITWTADTPKAVGDRVRAVEDYEHAYDVTTAGTTGSVEPVWSTESGTTVTDGTVVYVTHRAPNGNAQVWSEMPGMTTFNTSLWGWMSGVPEPFAP
jgi:hypothetical protein